MTLQGKFTPPFVDDGRIEVVGFTSAWHGLVLLAPNGHGTRLAQVKLWCPKEQAETLFMNDLLSSIIRYITLCCSYWS